MGVSAVLAQRTTGMGRTERLVLFFAVLAVAALEKPAPRFVYDPYIYWHGSAAFVSLGDVAGVAELATHGVLTPLVYTPAALMSLLLPGDPAGHLVVAQNAATLAAVAVWVVPLLVGRLVPHRRWHVWASCVAVLLLLRGFVPYPLMDVGAAALALLGLACLLGEGRRQTFLAALAWGIAANLRPAYIVPAVVVLMVWFALRRRSAGALTLGLATAALPQLMYNVMTGQSWVPWPAAMSVIGSIQARYSNYVVRYDTILVSDSSDPRLFFCSPGMASVALEHHPLSGMGGAAWFLLSHPAEGIAFGLQKVAASLQWSEATPYFDPTAGISVLTLFVMAVASLGACCLGVLLTARSGQLRFGAVLLSAWALATSGLLVLSTPESRFAVPLVLALLSAGIAGVDRLRFDGASDRSKTLTLLSATAALAGLTFWAGSVAVSYAAPRGDVNAQICSTTTANG